MYIMYINASNNTPSYTHVSSYKVWRVHPPPPQREYVYSSPDANNDDELAFVLQSVY